MQSVYLFPARFFLILLLFIATILFSSCVTPGITTVGSPLVTKFGKYEKVALIYDKSPSIPWNKAAQIYMEMNVEIETGLRQIGYSAVYNSKNAKKADLWIRIRLDRLEEWFFKKAGINVYFIDARAGKKIGAITVTGEDNSGPPVLIGVGPGNNGGAIMGMANAMMKGPVGNAPENAGIELIKYITKNQ